VVGGLSAPVTGILSSQAQSLEIIPSTTGAGCSLNVQVASGSFMRPDVDPPTRPGAVRFMVDQNLQTIDRNGTLRVGGILDIPIAQTHPIAFVRLTWDTNRVSPAYDVDMDLHAIEPDGTHVHAGNRVGKASYLERDNRPHLGHESAETIVIDAPAPVGGRYEVFIHHSGSQGANSNGDTTSTIAITVDFDSAPSTTTITRQTTVSGVSLNVANVFVKPGRVEPVGGSR
jgi:uncharacterized protein YfaP (DUF2135 family)